MPKDLTVNEFNGIRSLANAENQLFYRVKEGEKQAKEPHLREELQKLSAAVSNHKQALMELTEVSE